MRFLTLTVSAIAAAGLLHADAARAQAYPNKPVKLVVGYPPGGGADIVGRIVAQGLSERMGQQFVVMNVAGASGAVAAGNIARTEADGYTIFLGQTAEMSILPNLSANVRYDPVKDFAAISQITTYPYVLVVNPSLPFRSVAEFVAYAKANPGALNYGTPGPGSAAHLAVELFSRATGAKLTHVPFRGTGPAIQAVVAGHIQFAFGDAASTNALAESGQLRALGVTAGKRSPKLPDVPTMAEAGVAGYEVAAWHGLFAPAGTPAEIVQKLAAETAALLRDPALRERFARDGIEGVGSTPPDFATYVAREVGRWGQVAKDANIRID